MLYDKEGSMLTEQQRNHFETFGYLLMKGCYSEEEIRNITLAFDQVLDDDRQGEAFAGEKRQAVLGCVEKHQVLCNLVTDDRIFDPIHALLGDDFVWIGSDGNLYVGNTGWHPDGSQLEYARVKVAFYLDPVRRESGCLRVIPGSHILPLHEAVKPLSSQRADLAVSPFGVDAEEVPSVPLESNPGDMVCFNQNLWHASFGGEKGRRMFTLNFGEKPRTDDHIAYLKRTYESNLGFVKSMQHTQTGRVYEESFLDSDSPRIRGMVSKLIELGFK
jgi:hypothetical protein